MGISLILLNFASSRLSHDAGCLATAIETLYGDKDLRLQYGKNGRKLVEDNFEQHIIWKEIEKLYIKTL